MSIALLLANVAPVSCVRADTDADAALTGEGLRNALRSAGLSDDPNAPWTPDRVTVAALYADPALRTARLTAQVAAADAQITAQRANPVFSLSPERVISAVGETSPWTIVASLAIPWMRRSEYASRQEASKLDMQMAQLTLASNFWQSRSRSLAALRRLLIARDIEALAINSRTAQSSWATGVQKRMTLGDAERAELVVAEDAATTADADYATRTGQRAMAELELASVLGGIAPQLVARMQFEWPQLQAPPEPAVVSAANPAAAALVNRLEVQTLTLQEQAAEAHLREANAGRVPKTGVTPTATYDRGDRKVGLGADVELPIYHGPGTAIRRATAARQEAAAKLEQRKREIVTAADSSVVEYSSRYAQWQSSRTAVNAARGSERQAQRALTVGEGDRPTLLQATARRAALEVQSLDALQQTLDALAVVEDVTEHPIWPASSLGDVRKETLSAVEDTRADTP